MKKLVQVVVSAAIVAGSLFVAAGSAWAYPCTRGETIVGKTDTAWLCKNIATGAIREVPLS
jgi:hypothetical protein